MVRLGTIRRIAIALAVTVLLIWLAWWTQMFQVTSRPQLSDAELQAQALELSEELVVFLGERQAGEPYMDSSDWDASVDRIIKYGQETQNLYAREYGGRVAYLRGEFLKRRMRDDELDVFYESPTNYIGLRTVAVRLSLLAHELEAFRATQTTE